MLDRMREFHEHEKMVGGYKYFFIVILVPVLVFLWFHILGP